MTEQYIAPCPRCGQQPQVTALYCITVACDQCYDYAEDYTTHEMGQALTKEGAIAEWNQRIEDGVHECCAGPCNECGDVDLASVHHCCDEGVCAGCVPTRTRRLIDWEECDAMVDMSERVRGLESWAAREEVTL